MKEISDFTFLLCFKYFWANVEEYIEYFTIYRWLVSFEFVQKIPKCYDMNENETLGTTKMCLK